MLLNVKSRIGDALPSEDAHFHLCVPYMPRSLFCTLIQLERSENENCGQSTLYFTRVGFV